MPSSSELPSLLLVEDDPTMRMFLQRLLQEDYAVTDVASGQEALEAFAEAVPDVMVLDLGLPDRSGHEVLTTLGASYDLQETAILVLSGAESSDASVQSLRLGADDYLNKPFNPEELRVRLARLQERTAS
jgi:two-component system KDP operon response regulator KdpE